MEIVKCKNFEKEIIILPEEKKGLTGPLLMQLVSVLFF
jgi:hypothetical protein